MGMFIVASGLTIRRTAMEHIYTRKQMRNMMGNGGGDLFISREWRDGERYGFGYMIY
jgi:hypothetical protein